MVGCWHGYLSGARCRLAYGPADATLCVCVCDYSGCPREEAAKWVFFVCSIRLQNDLFCVEWVQIVVATLSGNSLRQTVHTHCASVHQAAKLVAALLRVARVTAGLVQIWYIDLP